MVRTVEHWGILLLNISDLTVFTPPFLSTDLFWLHKQTGSDTLDVYLQPSRVVSAQLLVQLKQYDAKIFMKINLKSGITQN